MKQTVAGGLMMLALVWLLVWLYEQLPPLQGWIIFGTIAGLAMSKCCPDKPARGAP